MAPAAVLAGSRMCDVTVLRSTGRRERYRGRLGLLLAAVRRAAAMPLVVALCIAVPVGLVVALRLALVRLVVALSLCLPLALRLAFVTGVLAGRGTARPAGALPRRATRQWRCGRRERARTGAGSDRSRSRSGREWPADVSRRLAAGRCAELAPIRGHLGDLARAGGGGRSPRKLVLSRKEDDRGAGRDGKRGHDGKERSEEHT